MGMQPEKYSDNLPKTFRKDFGHLYEDGSTLKRILKKQSLILFPVF
jgi:hypothetical protein